MESNLKNKRGIRGGNKDLKGKCETAKELYIR